MTESLPPYVTLPPSKAAPNWRSAWGVFGAESQLGTLELLTPERRLDALSFATEGVCINLDHPLSIPLSIFKHRTPFVHDVFEIMPGYYDETLDHFAPQLSSQWDAFRHVRGPDGFYNGLLADDQALTPGAQPLGIDQVSMDGIVGRGVLLDVERYLRETDEPIDPNVRREIAPALLDEVAQAQGVSIQTGDILLLRFGVDTFIRGLSDGSIDAEMRYDAPGLQQDEQTLEWLWDNHVAVACGDNIAIEVTPPRGRDTRLHPAFLGLLGLSLGELFDMSDLGDVAASRRRYEFLFMAKPSRIPGGLGSPANAMAIF